MKADTFHAKHPVQFWLGVVILMVMGGWVIYSAPVGADHNRRLDVVAMGLVALAYAFWLGRHVRKVEFGPDRMVVHRLWFPHKEMAYSEIVEVGAGAIRCRQWTLRYWDIVNREDLRERIGILIGQGKIPRPQAKNQLDQEEANRWVPIILGISGGGLLNMLMVLTGIVGNLDQVQGAWVSLGTFVVAYVIVTVIRKLGTRR